MRKTPECAVRLGIRTAERSVHTATINFAPDHSISFALNDRTFVSPLADFGRNFVFNFYNQVKSEFLIAHDAQALRSVPNPHFTFHPAVRFHLVGRSRGRYETLFDGIMDVELMLEAGRGPIPWIRAISRPVSEVKTARLRSGAGDSTEHLLPIDSEAFSVGVAVDFVPAKMIGEDDASTISFPMWKGHRLRVSIELLMPQVPTLAWYHFH